MLVASWLCKIRKCSVTRWPSWHLHCPTLIIPGGADLPPVISPLLLPDHFARLSQLLWASSWGTLSWFWFFTEILSLCTSFFPSPTLNFDSASPFPGLGIWQSLLPGQHLCCSKDTYLAPSHEVYWSVIAHLQDCEGSSQAQNNKTGINTESINMKLLQSFHNMLSLSCTRIS